MTSVPTASFETLDCRACLPPGPLATSSSLTVCWGSPAFMNPIPFRYINVSQTGHRRLGRLAGMSLALPCHLLRSTYMCGTSQSCVVRHNCVCYVAVILVVSNPWGRDLCNCSHPHCCIIPYSRLQLIVCQGVLPRTGSTVVKGIYRPC